MNTQKTMADCEHFQIVTDAHHKISDLKDLPDITFSPHIGNFHPSMLSLLALGIEPTVFDRNQTNMDYLYHPDTRIRDGQKTPITDVRGRKLLSPYLAGPDGESVAHTHMDVLRKQFPGMQILTDSERMSRNAGRIGQACETLIDDHPEQFNRYVDEQGLEYRYKAQGSLLDFEYFSADLNRTVTIPRRRIIESVLALNEQMAHSVDHNMPCETGGVSVSNQLNYVLYAFVQELVTGVRGAVQDLYHCSGQAMINYLKNPEYYEMIDLLYGVIREKLTDLDLPAVKFHVIPTIHMKFGAIDAAHAEIYQRLFDLLVEMRAVQTELSLLSGLDSKRGQELLVKKRRGEGLSPDELRLCEDFDRFTKIGKRKRILDGELGVAVKSLKQTRYSPGYRTGVNLKYFTQHDMALLANGKPPKVVFPQGYTDLTVAEAEEIFNLYKSLQCK